MDNNSAEYQPCSLIKKKVTMEGGEVDWVFLHWVESAPKKSPG